MTVIASSLSAWCQSSMIVSLGTEVMEDNSFDSAKVSFTQRGMPLDKFPSGKYGYMSERPLLMAVIDASPNNTIKEVDFLCGATFWWEINLHLEEDGYTLDDDGYVKLGNGDTVPQKSYSKGNLLCLVQTIDNDVKQVIFKRKVIKSSTKKKK